MKAVFGLVLIILNEIIKLFRNRPRVSLLLMFGLWVNSLPLPDETIVSAKPDPPVERIFGTTKALGISGGDGFPIRFSAKREKFDLVLHARLMKTFPDWEARMDYQKKQEKFYKSAIKKQTELKRLRIKDTSGFYTKEEEDPINYFHGKGFYAKQQDPNMKPNIFGTRQSFLIKMHNPVMRKNFLNSLKNYLESF